MYMCFCLFFSSFTNKNERMACVYCNKNIVQYEEGEDAGKEALQFCSYMCQANERSIDHPNHLSLYMKALVLDASETDLTLNAPITQPKSLGPESELPYTVPVAIRKFILACTKYMASLTLFDQYIVWRYTMGSAAVNAFLIFGKVQNEKDTIKWCYLFFLYWKNTSQVMNGGIIPSEFDRFTPFFEEPRSFISLRQEQALLLSKQLIPLYIASLNRLIRATPPVQTGFHVFKVASDYPGLPTSETDVPKRVKQLPFNSTTINPHFNFALFSTPTAKGNLFDLRIRKGSRVLYVPAEFHAYPFQKEIILPSDTTFVINTVYQGVLDVIDPDTVDMVTLQPRIMMGPVYEINLYKPCKSETCKITKKPFTVFLGDYEDK